MKKKALILNSLAQLLIFLAWIGLFMSSIYILKIYKEGVDGGVLLYSGLSTIIGFVVILSFAKGLDLIAEIAKKITTEEKEATAEN